MKYKLVAAVVALAVSFAFGRYSAPTKTVETKETTQDESEKTRVERDKKVVETEITRPDGTKEKTRITETHTEKDKDKKSDVEVKESKIVERSQGLSLSVLAGPNVTNLSSPLVFGAHASKPFLGPISVGVWGLSSGVGGLSIGIQF